MNETERDVAGLKGVVSSLMQRTKEDIIHGVRITVVRGKITILIPQWGWYILEPPKNVDDIKCGRCKNKKSVILFPPNTDICKMCQRDLQWDETLKKQHEVWQEEHYDQQDEEAADSECFTIPSGECIAPNCKLHGPVVLDCAKCDKPHNRCSCE